MHTPGSESQADSVTTEAILAKLAKAKAIETNLENLAAKLKSSKSSSRSKLDEKIQALRLQLCEVLSDVILNDSQLANSNDAIGRLWKVCFYTRINDIRSRILKERTRSKKRAISSTSAAEVEKSKKIVSDLEKQLKTFLGEAIQLYQYIIERYVKELMPLSQSQTYLSGMSNEEEEEEEGERSLVIIANLFKMHIHLGDLYRYNSDGTKAEECYSKAAKLAPGTGNPFNQLAVVAQQPADSKDSSSLNVVALYYYARSLMATRAPFETSRSNLARLFETNRKWMEEHLRDDDDHSRGIVNVGNMNERGAASGGNDDTNNNNNNNKRKKGQQAQKKEWMQKERQTMNRKAMARMVDLQWAFFRGIMLDDDDDSDGGSKHKGRINLDALVKKMSSLIEALINLIGYASFSEALLLKLISILAFSTLGASNNGGRLVNVDGFDAKRAKDPKWTEGVLMTNQALAFSFLLRFCAVLAKDVDAMIAKRDANKLGSLRSLSPLLLGFRFATLLYEGECEWFHGLPFFPSSDGMAAAGSEMEGNSIYKLCKESHVEFWKAAASLSNRCDKLPMRKKKKSHAEGELELTNVKEFVDFHGFSPLAPFLDNSAATDSAGKKKKYATVEEVLDALADMKHSGGGKATEADTNLKINLFLSIIAGHTSPSSDKDDDFLTKNLDTNEREFILVDIIDEDEVLSKQQEETTSPTVQSPDVTADMDVDKSITDEKMDEDEVKDEDAVPLKMSYSEKGVALLTPAALLAGATGLPTNPPEKQPEPQNMTPLPVPLDSFLAPSALNMMSGPSADNTLQPSTIHPKQPESTSTTTALPRPPPGFSMQPPPLAAEQPQKPLGSSTGISLADFTRPHDNQQVQQQSFAFGHINQAVVTGGTMPQATGPTTNPTTFNMFETMNPFAQVPPQTAPFSSNFLPASSSSASLNQPPPGLLNPTMGGVNFQHQPLNNGNGLDPTLDFLLSNNAMQSMNKPSSTSALDQLVPSVAADQSEDPSESIMNFLFNETSSHSGHQPLYANRQQHSTPPTKNPFAT